MGYFTNFMNEFCIKIQLFVSCIQVFSFFDKWSRFCFDHLHKNRRFSFYPVYQKKQNKKQNAPPKRDVLFFYASMRLFQARAAFSMVAATCSGVGMALMAPFLVVTR